MPLKTRPFDPARYLSTPEGIAAYLNDALAEGDKAGILDALSVVARAVETWPAVPLASPSCPR
jgi:DNA-binding phage protein